MTKRKGELRDETPEEKVHEPSKPSYNCSHHQPCPEEIQGILQARVQLQDLPACALPVPRVVNDMTR